MFDLDSEMTIRRTRLASDTTRWVVVDAIDADGEENVLVGPLIHLEERERVHVRGVDGVTRTNPAP